MPQSISFKGVQFTKQIAERASGNPEQCVLLLYYMKHTWILVYNCIYTLNYYYTYEKKVQKDLPCNDTGATRIYLSK